MILKNGCWFGGPNTDIAVSFKNLVLIFFKLILKCLWLKSYDVCDFLQNNPKFAYVEVGVRWGSLAIGGVIDEIRRTRIIVAECLLGYSLQCWVCLGFIYLRHCLAINKPLIYGSLRVSEAWTVWNAGRQYRICLLLWILDNLCVYENEETFFIAVADYPHCFVHCFFFLSLNNISWWLFHISAQRASSFFCNCSVFYLWLHHIILNPLFTDICSHLFPFVSFQVLYLITCSYKTRKNFISYKEIHGSITCSTISSKSRYSPEL